MNKLIVKLGEGFSARLFFARLFIAAIMFLSLFFSTYARTSALTGLNPGATLNPTTAASIAVYVGYADNLRAGPNFPVPWRGSPGVVFIGENGTFDAGAIRIDNISGAAITVDNVSVDLQRPGPVFSLWGSFTIPANGIAILSQTNGENFDTSDFPIVGCGATFSPTDPRIPKVTITIGGVATAYLDTAHVLDTGGFDLACLSNESLQWRLIGTTGIANSSGQVLLNPNIFSGPITANYQATATVVDASSLPVANVMVNFKVLSGPNAGKTGQATTDNQGHAVFSYASTLIGTDTLQASVSNITGASVQSNSVTITWNAAADCH